MFVFLSIKGIFHYFEMKKKMEMIWIRRMHTGQSGQFWDCSWGCPIFLMLLLHTRLSITNNKNHQGGTFFSSASYTLLRNNHIFPKNAYFSWNKFLCFSCLMKQATLVPCSDERWWLGLQLGIDSRIVKVNENVIHWEFRCCRWLSWMEAQQ